MHHVHGPSPPNILNLVIGVMAGFGPWRSWNHDPWR